MKFSKFIFAVAVVFPTLLFAAGPYNVSTEEVFEAFRSYRNVSPNITIPTVIEIPFNEDSFQVPIFAVYNIDDKEFEPYYFSVKEISTGVKVEIAGASQTPSNINDGNYSTYVEFPVNGETNTATIHFNFDKPIEASSLYFVLDNYVQLPQFISITAVVDGKEYIVQREARPQGGGFYFPKTKSASWKVSFSYVQPLRISEMKINDLSQSEKLTGLRFLAQPGKNYQIYFDADRYTTSSIKESGNLTLDKDVVRQSVGSDVLNSKYKPADQDSDSVADLADNCVSIPNSDQKDTNQNFLGDACEDYDRDGILNSRDNCRDVPNSAQNDTDADGMGDVCDSLDNRVSERMPWLPWAGIVFAGGVIFGLFFVVLKHKRENTTIE